MSETAQNVTLVFSILTVLGQVFILFTIVLGVSKEGRAGLLKLLPPVRALWLGFLVSLFSILGTLYYSEIAGFAVCKLCWAQRIFLYPQTVLFAVALFKKDLKVALYSVPLALFGIFFSVYHHLVQITGGGISCGSTGPSCAKIYFSGFGYITFPAMSATAFLLIILFSILAYVGSKRVDL